MNNDLPAPITSASGVHPGLSAGGIFLEALARRDFEGMGRCLAPDVRFRALLPPRDVDVIGADATMEEFRRWFGSESETLELVDATVGEVGPRLYLRWRVRCSPVDGVGETRLVEQHAFATVDEGIETLSLLCSGFVAG